MSTIGAKTQRTPAADASAAAIRRGTLHRGRVPAARLAQRDREDRAVAVDHIEAEQDRDLRGGLLDGEPLHLVRVPGAAHIQERADPASPDEVALPVEQAP